LPKPRHRPYPATAREVCDRPGRRLPGRHHTCGGRRRVQPESAGS
jgi:hypothetical protein